MAHLSSIMAHPNLSTNQTHLYTKRPSLGSLAVPFVIKIELILGLSLSRLKMGQPEPYVVPLETNVSLPMFKLGPYITKLAHEHKVISFLLIVGVFECIPSEARNVPAEFFIGPSDCLISSSEFQLSPHEYNVGPTELNISH